MNLNENFKGFANLFNVKTRVDNGPSMDGRIKVDGAAEDDKGIRLAAFPKTGKDSGLEFLSLSVGDKENRVYGALFPNSRKEKDNQPDYTGSIDLPEGKKLYISGWNKNGPTAGDYISLSIEPALATQEAAKTEDQQQAAA